MQLCMVNVMQPIEVFISINDKKYAFQFDSGASISVISMDCYKKYFRNLNKLSSAIV